MPVSAFPIEVMGILNVTPDSFSDGGSFNTTDKALRHAEKMIAEGADWLDIGGESTRPGAKDVQEQEEVDRVLPVLEKIRDNFDVKVSVDTSKAKVMSESIRVGVDMINDVRALRETGALEAVADADCYVCLMHMMGQPRVMQDNPDYEDVVLEVKAFLEERVRICEVAGIDKSRLMIDPGFGFGKTVRHNYQLLNKLQAFHEMDLPMLIGLSRKSMLGAVTDRAVDERLAASLAGATISAMKGAKILRVHDVAQTKDIVQVVTATITGEC